MSDERNLRKGLNINEILSVKLAPEQVEECEEAFDMYDSDKDGIITTTELVPAMRALGYNTNRVLLRKIMELDIDADDGVGKLRLQDFQRFVLTCQRILYTRRDAMKALRAIDTDNDGRIAKSELASFLKGLKIPLSAEEIEDSVNAADFNGDGRIDYEAFVVMTMCPRDSGVL
jgi:calmodulin